MRSLLARHDSLRERRYDEVQSRQVAIHEEEVELLLILEFDMVSELVTSFFALGVEPQKIPIRVDGTPDADRLLAR
jgi:hypothetical protein